MDKLIEQGIKINMIFTDLPYGTTRLKWDSIIPIDELWTRYNKLIKDNGTIVLFGNEPFSSMLRQSNVKMYKYDIKWIKSKPTGFLNSHYRPMLQYEDIIIFSKANAGAGGKNKISMTYNPQGLKLVEKKVKNRKTTGGKIIKDTNNVGKNNVLNSDEEYIQKYTGYPSNVIYFDTDKNILHPTQKPIKLCEYLINTYSNENDLILDNCMGSGTTLLGCKKLNRRCVGIELDKKYYDIAKKRINTYLDNNN